jgi:hypothetical protein
MIDANRMGGLGLCASAGYMAQAIADGAQLNSFVTVAAWLHDSESLQKVFGEEGVRRRSDNSALPDSVRKFYNDMPGQKSLFWTQGQHTDFYDKEPYVTEAVQVAAAHFKNTLKDARSEIPF